MPRMARKWNLKLYEIEKSVNIRMTVYCNGFKSCSTACVSNSCLKYRLNIRSFNLKENNYRLQYNLGQAWECPIDCDNAPRAENITFVCSIIIFLKNMYI